MDRGERGQSQREHITRAEDWLSRWGPSPVLLPVRQQTEPQIPVTVMLKVQIIILSSFPQLASRKTEDLEPEHIVLCSERPCGLVPKAQERAKNHCPVVWSPGTRQPRAQRPQGVLPAGPPATAQLTLQHRTLARKRNTPPRGREDDHSSPWTPLCSHPRCLLSCRSPLTQIPRRFQGRKTGKRLKKERGGEDEKEPRP